MKSMLMLIAAAFALMLSACNTVEGMGKDLKKAGEAVEREVQKAKQ